MKSISIKRYKLALVVFLFLNVSLVCFPVKGDENLIRVLRVGVNEWINESEFKCNYTYMEGIVDSQEKAEKQPDDLDKITLNAEGQFIKTKKKTFVSLLVKQDLYTPRQSENFLGVINEQLEAHYTPDISGGSPRWLFVFERDKDKKGIPYPIVQPMLGYYPINYAAGFGIPNPIDIFNIVRTVDPDATIAVSWVASDRVQVSLHSKDAGGTQIFENVVFLTNHAYPVPVESYSKTTYATGKEYIRKCVASGFIEVGTGIVVPQCITQYSGPMFGLRGKEYEGKWQVQKWFSSDLGKEQPVDTDFLIPLAPNTTFGGLVTELEIEFMRTKPSHFDIDSLTLADLQISSLGEDLVASNTSRTFYFRLFCIVVGSALILIACIRIMLRMLAKK